MLSERILHLLNKYGEGACSNSEREELEAWYNERAVNEGPLLPEESDSAINRLTGDMLLQFRERLQQHKKVVSISRRKFAYRMGAAAAVLFAVCMAAFYLLTFEKKPAQVNAVPVPAPAAEEVMPGGNRATLTLADGRIIDLDTARDGRLALQAGSVIEKPEDGLLVYETGGDDRNVSEEPKMNIVQTPRGGQYQLKLPDGSRVWLNAASFIRFPVSFTGNERRVAISGEVYVEAARLRGAGGSIPFVVEILNGAGHKAGEVHVLGTQFNINAYDDEGAVRTTLLEGRVKVVHADAAGRMLSQMLSPGQQARMSENQLLIIQEVDVEEAVAWKNGLFRFNDADIQTLLRQASRWYDIEVEIRGHDPAERFRGKIRRDVTLSQFLRILEINQLSVQRNGKKIIIGE